MEVTTRAPATKAHLKRLIAAFEETGHRVLGCEPDGRLIVEKPDSAVPAFPGTVHHDAYVIAASGVRDAEKTRKRRARSS